MTKKYYFLEITHLLRRRICSNFCPPQVIRELRHYFLLCLDTFSVLFPAIL